MAIRTGSVNGVGERTVGIVETMPDNSNALLERRERKRQALRLAMERLGDIVDLLSDHGEVGLAEHLDEVCVGVLKARRAMGA